MFVFSKQKKNEEKILILSLTGQNLSGLADVS
jgi:hypothetical protein